MKPRKGQACRELKKIWLKIKRLLWWASAFQSLVSNALLRACFPSIGTSQNICIPGLKKAFLNIPTSHWIHYCHTLINVLIYSFCVLMKKQISSENANLPLSQAESCLCLWKHNTYNKWLSRLERNRSVGFIASANCLALWVMSWCRNYRTTPTLFHPNDGVSSLGSWLISQMLHALLLIPCVLCCILHVQGCSSILCLFQKRVAITLRYIKTDIVICVGKHVDQVCQW